MQIKDTQTFKYQYYDGRNYDDSNEEYGYPLSTEHSKVSIFSDCAPWDIVLRDFIRFLEGVYGYNISDQVEMSTMEERIAKAKFYTDADEDDLK